GLFQGLTGAGEVARLELDEPDRVEMGPASRPVADPLLDPDRLVQLREASFGIAQRETQIPELRPRGPFHLRQPAFSGLVDSGPDLADRALVVSEVVQGHGARLEKRGPFAAQLETV